MLWWIFIFIIIVNVDLHLYRSAEKNSSLTRLFRTPGGKPAPDVRVQTELVAQTTLPVNTPVVSHAM